MFLNTIESLKSTNTAVLDKIEENQKLKEKLMKQQVQQMQAAVKHAEEQKKLLENAINLKEEEMKKEMAKLDHPNEHQERKVKSKREYIM